jgi:hypothetical protein
MLPSAHGHQPSIPLDKSTTKFTAHHLSESQLWLEEESMETLPKLPHLLSLLSAETFPHAPSKLDSTMLDEPQLVTLSPLPFKYI